MAIYYDFRRYIWKIIRHFRLICFFRGGSSEISMSSTSSLFQICLLSPMLTLDCWDGCSTTKDIISDSLESVFLINFYVTVIPNYSRTFWTILELVKPWWSLFVRQIHCFRRASISYLLFPAYCGTKNAWNRFLAPKVYKINRNRFNFLKSL